MSKYKVGDRVRIVPLDKLKTCEGINYEGWMNHWAGEIMTIRQCRGKDYRMIEDKEEWHGGWYWSDEMIAGLAQPEIKINKDELLSFIGG